MKIGAAAAVAVMVCLSGASAAPAQPASATHKPAKPKARPPATAKTATKTTTKTTTRNAVNSGAKSVCVASAIGDTFNVQQIGLTIFENSLHTVAIGSWELDDVVVRRIGTAFGGGFAVRRINPPAAAMADVKHPKGGGLFSDGVALRKDAARTMAAGTKCDFYIAVTTSASSYSNTNQTLRGIGILKHGNMLISRHYLFAALTVQAFDGNTFELLRIKTPTSDATNLLKLMTTPRIDGLLIGVGKNFWPAAPEAAAHSGLLRNATRALVDQGLAKALADVLIAVNARLE